MGSAPGSTRGLSLSHQRLHTYRIRRTADVATLRERCRAAAEALGLASNDAVRIATASSEVARTIVERGGGGEVTLEVVVGEPSGLGLTFRTREPLLSLPDLSWDPLRAARLLSDRYDAEEHDGYFELRLIKYAPPRTDVRQRLESAREALLTTDAGASAGAIRSQNREMARILDELRRRGQELERMNDELMRANNHATACMMHLSELARRKDELAAGIAHDLRSPLSAVKGAIDLLSAGAGGRLSEEQKRYLEIADRAARHIFELVNDLLDSSLLDAGLSRAECEALELGLVVDEVSATIGFLAREKGIAFEVQLPPALPPIYADRHKLGQILSNLLTNAVKFTDAGGFVHLRAAPSGDAIAVEVVDSGVGIPASRQTELFDKYRRSRSRGTRGERGTGLGLYICRHLVEMHGGSLHVQSELGQGSTFRFTLPRALGAPSPPLEPP